MRVSTITAFKARIVMITFSKQQIEVERARRFVRSFGQAAARVRSLSDFVGETSSIANVNELDNMMPDVVAQLDGREVGIELTAYSDDEIKNAWSAFVPAVRTAVKGYSHAYPSLNGLLIGYHPNTNRRPPGKVDSFAQQLLQMVSELLPPEILECRRIRSFALSANHRIARPYQKWSLLEGYVTAVSVTVPGKPLDIPVDACTGFATTFGTRLEKLTQAIDKKARKKRKKCFLSGIDDFWLLIHADREPASSAVTPLDDYEIESILQSSAAESARESGFNKVILWDGIWDGYVDLVSGGYVSCQR
jgi:hypothetical protein